MPLRTPRRFAVVAYGLPALLAGVVVYAAVAGFTGSPLGATLVSSLLSGCLLGRALASGPWDAALAAVPRSLRILFTAGAVLLLVQVAATTVFIIEPTIATWSARPWTPLRSTHSCISAYWVACQAVDSTPNVYDDALYNLPQADPAAPRNPRSLGPLQVDNYEYPPAFLALPRLLARAAGDFWSFRRVWFALTLAVTVVGLILVGRRLDDAADTHALWLAPFVLLPPAMIGTLLVGNVQLAIIAAAMIAMILIERKHHAAGGALLAYATLSKLYPALLIFYLLLRRDWRALGWTAGAGLVIVLVTIADFGLAPYLAFVAELPDLLGGEAFSAFRNPVSIAVNESIPGLAFKLKLFGVPNMGFTASKILAWGYTLVVVALTARLALRPASRDREPLVWLTILILATMRSPFLPTYAPFPSLWLATLIAALTWGHGRIFVATVAAWCVLAFTFGTGGASPQVNAAWTLVHTIMAFVLVALAFRVAHPVAAADVRWPVLNQSLPA